jgi:hypothetical protein
MSFGGGQGQIRYALLVDDQATAKLNTFKNSMVQLGSSTTTIQSKMQGFTASLTKESVPVWHPICLYWLQRKRLPIQQPVS